MQMDGEERQFSVSLGSGALVLTNDRIRYKNNMVVSINLESITATEVVEETWRLFDYLLVLGLFSTGLVLPSFGQVIPVFNNPYVSLFFIVLAIVAAYDIERHKATILRVCTPLKERSFQSTDPLQLREFETEIWEQK
jgi:hypothetical protein